MYQLQILILEMIARGEPLRLVADSLCRRVEADFPGITCTVLAVDRSGLVHPIAAPSLAESYFAALDNAMIGPNAGSCGSAAYYGSPVVVEDISIDPRWASHGKAAIEQGFLACFSSPIFDSNERVIGALALYYRERRGPTEGERKVAETCVRLCGIAMERHGHILDGGRRTELDALTGLPNQNAFRTALAALSCDQPGGWAILLVDLDNLKIANDTFGHHVGDRLLQGVGTRIAATAGRDRTFRIGGDEFAVIIQDPVVLLELEAKAEAVLHAISAPLECDDYVITPHATIGGAVVSAAESTPDAVHRNADFALYHAKETQRGGFVRYWPGIGTRMTERLITIRSIDLALAEDRIVAYYQPYVRLGTRQIIGVEALCRLITPGGEIVPAGVFSEAISDARIASALTDRMLGLIGDDMRRWLDMGLPLQHMGVNATSADFRSGNLRDTLMNVFGARGIPVNSVTLEVTERVYIGEHDHVVSDAVQALRSSGFRVALDDFGTGYASLTHLLSVPVDAIKIDRSFVSRLLPGDPSMVIVEGIIDIAHKLGIRVVAEGIETVEQEAELTRLGCAVGQGFLFSRAVDADRLAELLRLHGEGLPNATPMPISSRGMAAQPRQSPQRLLIA